MYHKKLGLSENERKLLILAHFKISSKMLILANAQFKAMRRKHTRSYVENTYSTVPSRLDLKTTKSKRSVKSTPE